MTSAAAEGQGTPCYSIKWKYGVHICFNGQEIENSLIGCFKHAFHKRGIKTTIDDLGNGRGEEISQTAVKAIQESRSSIVVFCPKFPFNRRCLDELVTILDCKRRYGQLLQPVFFQIQPTVIRNRRGCYEEALAEHLRKFKNEMEVNRWELALHDVANLHGWSFKSGSESQLIQGIVESISMNIHIPSCNADCLAGQLRITKPQALFGLGFSDDVVTVENGSEGRGAQNLPKAAGLKPLFTSSHRKEPENRERFIAFQPSTSSGYTLKDMFNPLGHEGTDIMQYNSLLNRLHSEGNATKKRKSISNGVKFNVEANAPRKQILTEIKYFQLLDSRGIEDDLIPRKLKGRVEAFSASVGGVNSTLLAVEDAGTVVTRTSEEVMSFMQTVQTYASKGFRELIGEGTKFKEHIKKNVLRFCADGKISPGMCVVLYNLLRDFTCWSQDYDRANTELETTAADLSKADKLQADFEAVVNDSEKAISAEKEVLIQLDHMLRKKGELEEELEAVKSEIDDLSSSRQEVALRKSLLLDEGTKLKEEKDNLMVQVPRIMGEQAAARFTQEFIEAEWLEHAKLFNEIFKSEFGCS